MKTTSFYAGQDNTHTWLQKREQPVFVRSFVLHYTIRQTTKTITVTVHVKDIWWPQGERLQSNLLYENLHIIAAPYNFWGFLAVSGTCAYLYFCRSIFIVTSLSDAWLLFQILKLIFVSEFWSEWVQYTSTKCVGLHLKLYSELCIIDWCF